MFFLDLYVYIDAMRHRQVPRRDHLLL